MTMRRFPTARLGSGGLRRLVVDLCHRLQRPAAIAHDPATPRRETWCYLDDEFLGQKESRAHLLETQFRNLRQDSMMITDYCRKLKTMAASLGEFGDPIGDRQIVLTLLCGLSGKFHHMVSILKMHRLFRRSPKHARTCCSRRLTSTLAHRPRLRPSSPTHHRCLLLHGQGRWCSLLQHAMAILAASPVAN